MREIEQTTIDSSMDGPRLVGLLTLVLVFGVFGGWAALAPLDSAARAPGTVTVESYKKSVQHLEGGIVSDIHVRDGDLIRAGEALLTLSSTQPQAQLEIANAQVIALRVREARLIAERDNLQAIDYPSTLDRQDPRVREEMAAQEGIFAARRAAQASSREVLAQRIEQLRSQIEGYRALRASREQLAASYEEELVDTRELLSKGFSERTRLRELERNVASFQGEAADLSASIAGAEVQIGEVQLQLILIDQEFLRDVVSELGETQTALKDVSERIIALRDVVARTVITAPDSGIVNGMRVHTVGGVIAPGTTIAEIVPQNEGLIIEAQVSPTDVDRVSADQEATIRFSAFGSTVPTIEARVLSLSADRLIDEATGVSYFLARLEVSPEGRDDLGDLVLLPGMPAEAYINTGSRTFLQYLFRPFSNALARSFNED